MNTEIKKPRRPRKDKGKKRRKPYQSRAIKMKSAIESTKTPREQLLSALANTLADLDDAALLRLVKRSHKAEAWRLARRCSKVLGYPQHTVERLAKELMEMPIPGVPLIDHPPLT